MLISLEKKQPKGNWKQRLIEPRIIVDEQLTNKKNFRKNNVFRKSLLYILFLKKFSKGSESVINHSNLKLLKIFLTKYAKIKSRRKTKINVQEQKQISKAIRRARVEGLLPFTTKVLIKKPLKKKINNVR